ncbi:hypothetical protein [Microcoleus sp. Pol12B5]|uniref:hypothetical protein n=1 Tax=Microcoleus sp. Pol12B5 TaxID=3055396 RepID=UPI002FCF466A
MATTPTITKTPTTKVKLGVTFDLNGEPIALQPKEAIDQIKEKGIELTLPQKVKLGKAGDGINSILENLKSDYRVSVVEGKKNIKEQLPAFKILTDTYDKVMTAELSVEKFHVKIPGSGTVEKSTLYTIGLSAVWGKSDQGTDLSGLTLTGIYLEISNEETSTEIEKTNT